MPKFRENILKMGHYKPPLEGRASKDYLLLDFNEMTLEPSPKVKKALKKFADFGKLQAYPEYGDLNNKIAQYAGVKPSQVMVTNGSDQGIDVIFRAFVIDGDKVIIPSPSFAMFYQSAGIQGAEILKPSYRADASFPLEETLDLINQDVKLVIIVNPNNPTGTALSIEDVEKILKKAKDKNISVLHDEAYFEFSKITAKDLIPKFDNLFITRTFSKTFGLVSTRVGYVLTQEDNIKELLKIRGPYDVNMFAKTAVISALEDPSYMENYVKEVMEQSKPRLERFLEEKGVSFFPSIANFLFLKISDSKQVIADLKAEGVLVRPKKGPGNEDGIRVSIGSLQDTEKFIEAFNKIIRG